MKRAERGKTKKCTRKRECSYGLKEGESCLFLRQYCMSPGNPIYHFTACKICSFPVNHSTNILLSFAFSITVQLCVILVCSFFSTLLSWTFSLCALVYREVNGANPTSLGIHVYFLWSSAPSSPAHRGWPKGSPQRNSQPLSVLTAAALPKVWPQETLHSSSKSICNSSITRTGCKQMLYFWSPYSSTLS